MRSFLETDGWHDSDFSDISWESFHEQVCRRDVEGSYKIFCNNFEQMIANAHERLQISVPIQQFQGRSSPKTISQPLHTPVVGQSRSGDPAIPVDDAPKQLRQRIRQARRITTVKSQLTCASQRDTDTAIGVLQAARNTWEAILVSPGFPQGFPAFSKLTLGLVLPSVITVEHLPLVHVLESSINGMVSKWYWQNTKLRKHRYMETLLADWNKGGRFHFAAIRPSPKPEIALLEVPFPMEITRHRHPKRGPFVITSTQPLPEGVTCVQFGEQRCGIIKTESNHVWLDRPIKAQSARVKVCFLKPTGSLGDVHNLTIQYWTQFWQSTDTAQLDTADEILQNFSPIPPFPQGITLLEVQKALKKVQVDKARGPDSWSPWEVKNMPPPFVVGLTSLFNLFLEEATWPTALTQATVAMLSKQDGAFMVEQTRPSTILSMIYRI